MFPRTTFSGNAAEPIVIVFLALELEPPPSVLLDEQPANSRAAPASTAPAAITPLFDPNIS
jgi:hypothetical protein